MKYEDSKNATVALYRKECASDRQRVDYLAWFYSRGTGAQPIHHANQILTLTCRGNRRSWLSE